MVHRIHASQPTPDDPGAATFRACISKTNNEYLLLIYEFQLKLRTTSTARKHQSVTNLDFLSDVGIGWDLHLRGEWVGARGRRVRREKEVGRERKRERERERERETGVADILLTATILKHF